MKLATGSLDEHSRRPAGVEWTGTGTGFGQTSTLKLLLLTGNQRTLWAGTFQIPRELVPGGLAHGARLMRMVPVNEVSSTVALPVLWVEKRLFPEYDGDMEFRLTVSDSPGSGITLPCTVLALSSKEAEVGHTTWMSPL